MILEGYGLTETSPVLSANRPDKCKFGTVGEPLSGVEIKIAPDREILARGAIVMKGYYRDGRRQWRRSIENFFQTGDLGFIDSDNYLTIIGRKKEMMVTAGGKNIWPKPIEQQLDIDKYIDQSMIIAHCRRFVAALIVPDWQEVELYLKSFGLPRRTPGELVGEPQIIKLFADRIAAINANLPEYEQIRKFRLLTNEFSQEKDEVTPTLKLRRSVICSRYQKEIEQMYL